MKEKKKDSDQLVMKEEYSLSIGANNLLNEMIWPATRYCIGRHSYVSNYAQTYWSIIQTNRDKFDEERLQFYARDIKDNIARLMHLWHNVRCENTGNDRIVYDPYFLLTRWMHMHPGERFGDYDFRVDCMDGDIIALKRPVPLTDSEMTWCKIPDCDLSKWSKLASCLSDTVIINTVDNNSFHAVKTYSLTRYSAEEGYEWEERYVDVNNWYRYIPSYLIQSIDNGER